MADFYPLIAKAVSGLDKNTGENRRALYDRAFSALVSQLRGVEPPLDETDITRERLALEEAIRKVEAEASKRPRSDASEAEPAEPSLRDRGLRDFRETVAEAEGLGSAAAEAKRAAHATYEAMPDEPDGSRHVEPPVLPEPPPVSEPSLTAEVPQEPHHASRPPPAPGAYDDDDEYTRHPARSYAGLVKLFALFVVLSVIAGGLYWQR